MQDQGNGPWQRFGGFGGFGPGRPVQPAGSGLFLYLPGAFFAGLGLAILLVPELFRYLVAVLCLGLGAILILAASQMRGARRREQKRHAARNIMAFFRSDDRD